MSKQTSRRTAPKRRPQARKGRAVVAAHSAGKRSDRTSWIIAAVVLAIGVALVIVFAGASKNKVRAGEFISGRRAAPAALVAKVVGVPQKTLTAVGKGSVTGLPLKLPGATPLKTSDGKPRVVYLGAEYCPFCAAERWGMLNAFSRFGTFKNVKITTSAVTTPQGLGETDPDTPTFSFYGSTYTSPYISFESVEQEDNSYKQLETASTEQAGLASTYDVEKYTGSSDSGAIPFIDFGNEYMISGASYEPSILQNMSHDQVAAALADPGTDASKGVIGTANVITATVCKLTDNKPAKVCTDPAITAIQAELPTKPLG